MHPPQIYLLSNIDTIITKKVVLSEEAVYALKVVLDRLNILSGYNTTRLIEQYPGLNVPSHQSYLNI